MLGIGEAAALATAVSWAGSAQFFTLVGRRLGGPRVTVARAPFAVAGVALVALAMGADLTTPLSACFFLFLSAASGVALSDTIFYTACVAIGPRLGLLVKSLSSCITAMLGYFLLGENIGPLGAAGILVATFGVGFVVLDSRPGDTSLASIPRDRLWRGVALAFASAFCTAVSFFFLKVAMRQNVDPLWGACLRVGFGGLCMWSFALVRGTLFSTLRDAWNDRKVVLLLLLACSVSNFGNCLNVVAMKHTASGIAAMLINLQPIAIIPINFVVEHRLPGVRGVAGTVIAFVGTAMLIFR